VSGTPAPLRFAVGHLIQRLRSPVRSLGRLLTAVLAAAVVGACGGDDGSKPAGGEGRAAAESRARLNGADTPRPEQFPAVQGRTLQQLADSINASGTQLGLATSVYTPGRNRLAFGVIGDRNQFVYAPTAVYTAPTPNSRATGPHLAPADLLVTEPAFRSRQAASEEDPFAAVYQTTVDLGEPGNWPLLVVSKVGERLVAAATQVRVKRTSRIPSVGEKAPVVETDTAADDGGIEAVDTRRPTDDMHDVSLEDVVGKKPVMLLFATPQLCQSRVCGPVVDIAAQLKARYGDEVEFIHQEVYVDNDPNKGLREPLRRFGLTTEPWLFAIDRNGMVVARHEGSFGLKAFEKAVIAARSSA
jgi:hypothetical protein